MRYSRKKAWPTQKSSCMNEMMEGQNSSDLWLTHRTSHLQRPTAQQAAPRAAQPCLHLHPTVSPSRTPPGHICCSLSSNIACPRHSNPHSHNLFTLKSNLFTFCSLLTYWSYFKNTTETSCLNNKLPNILTKLSCFCYKC